MYARTQGLETERERRHGEVRGMPVKRKALAVLDCTNSMNTKLIGQIGYIRRQLLLVCVCGYLSIDTLVIAAVE